MKTAPAKINDVYVVHFVLDGANWSFFKKLVHDGKLPTVKRIFFDDGAVFDHGMSLFPTTSATVYQSYMTGLHPGHVGIPFIQRLNRQNGNITDYLTIGGYDFINSDVINLRALINPKVGNLNPPTTIFELLHGHFTASVYDAFHRGATIVRPKVPIRAMWNAFVNGNPSKVSVLAYNEVIKLFKSKKQPPRYTLAAILSSDIMGHQFGPYDDRIAALYFQFDVFLRDFVNLLKDKGIFDKTYIVVTSDHGMHPTSKLFHIQKMLKQKGIRVKSKNPKYKNYDLFITNRGVASEQIYARHDRGFKPTNSVKIFKNFRTMRGNRINLIDAILSLPPTQFLIVRRGDYKARIYDTNKRYADIDCYLVGLEPFCSYKFNDKKGDPLGYSKESSLAALLDNKPHSGRRWELATASMRYPDAVANLGMIFNDTRAGDAFIMAKTQYGFRKLKKGNHGGMSITDMNTLYMIHGPNVIKGGFDAARPEDIFALLVKWFGIKLSNHSHDGLNPFYVNFSENQNSVDIAELMNIFENSPPVGKIINVPYFIKTEIAPKIRPSRFNALEPIAQKEIKIRLKSIKKIRTYLIALTVQKNDKEAPVICDGRYIDDHIFIVKHVLNRIQDELNMLDDIDTVLGNCTNPDSVECERL